MHQIGVGVLGPVFRTYEPARDRLVAVKVFRLDLAPEQAQALADQLARAAEADLFHPSIVEPIAAGVEGTDAYRAEEYVAAEPLDAAMRHDAPATLDSVVRIVSQIGAALDAARAAGVGHGALTPRDVFVSADEARASGFGIVDALERVGLSVPGQAPYSAPERIAGESWDLPADVFSLAAIALELLAGHAPGTAPSDQPLAGSLAVRDVLAQAMHDDPDQRFGTGQAFVEALAAVAAGDMQSASSAAGVVHFPGDRVGSSIRMISMPVDAPQFADEEPADEAMAADHVDALPAREDDAASDQPVPYTNVDFEPQFEGASDDVTVERDEDVAHWTLSREESREEARDDDAVSTRYRDIDAAAAKDALMFDAAEMVLQERDPVRLDVDDLPSGTQRQRELIVDEALVDAVPPAATAAPWLIEESAAEPQQVIERAPWQEPAREMEEAALAAHSTPYTDRARLPLVPIAAGLVAALLVGILAGYLVWGRDAAAPTASVAGGAASTPSGGAGPAAGAAAGPASVTPAGGAEPGPAARASATAPADVRPRPSRVAAATPAARAGKLNVQSTPAGANVLINGRWSGRTPFTRDALALGAYTVRVTMPGFESRREQFNLTAAAPSRSIALQLRQTGAAARAAAPGTTGRGAATSAAASASAANVGALEVDSRPAGARVLLDGAALGTTPLKAPDVTPGQHTIRLELAGHQPWTQNTQVVRGRTTRVAGSLEPIR